MLYNTLLNHPAPVGYSSEDAEPTSCVVYAYIFRFNLPLPQLHTLEEAWNEREYRSEINGSLTTSCRQRSSSYKVGE